MERLAIEGGRPVRGELLPYGHQWIDDEDIAAVAAALRGDWITQGPKVDEFEKKVADYCGARFAVAVANGTAALHAACAVAGLSAGDEAVVTPITFAATANAVVYCGARPVFADIRADTLNIDPLEILKRITPQTKAILPVDFAGHPADLDAVLTIAREKTLTVIEDACHALGAEYRGRRIGSIADMSVFSFHPVKHITTGEGGMILTNNKVFYEKLRIFRHHGIIKGSPDKGSWHYEISRPGYNFRITDFQCALGISQLKKLDWFIQRRREIVSGYNEAFSGSKEIITPFEEKHVKSAYHIYIIQLRLDKLKAGRKEVLEALKAENIGAIAHYMPLHLHPYYREQFGYQEGDYPRAETYYNRAITLPIFPGMTGKDIDDVIAAVRKVVGHYAK